MLTASISMKGEYPIHEVGPWLQQIYRPLVKHGNGEFTIGVFAIKVSVGTLQWLPFYIALIMFDSRKVIMVSVCVSKLNVVTHMLCRAPHRICIDPRFFETHFRQGVGILKDSALKGHFNAA